MKLSTLRVKQALDQLEPRTVVVPEHHPKASELNEIFGDHTFFLDNDGLEIIEPVVTKNEENAGELVRVAVWSNEARTELAPHSAQATGIIILFPSENARFD